MNDYTIAGLRFRIEGDTSDLAALGLDGFAPFATTSGAEADCTMRLDVECGSSIFGRAETLGMYDLSEADAECRFARCDTGHLLQIVRRAQPDRPVMLHKEYGRGYVVGNPLAGCRADLPLLRFGLWTMAALTMAGRRAVAIHSSAIVYRGQAVLFLGESGTGKSTHTRLWRENIDSARLLNDDSPIIRIVEDADGGEAVVAYGSPWSGKTPCYKNESYPVRAICRLSQAPHNRIERLSTIRSIGALLPSCPPAFAYDAELQDTLCRTLSDIIERVPVYRLECLPDADAALLACKTIFDS